AWGGTARSSKRAKRTAAQKVTSAIVSRFRRGSETARRIAHLDRITATVALYGSGEAACSGIRARALELRRAQKDSILIGLDRPSRHEKKHHENENCAARAARRRGRRSRSKPFLRLPARTKSPSMARPRAAGGFGSMQRAG